MWPPHNYYICSNFVFCRPLFLHSALHRRRLLCSRISLSLLSLSTSVLWSIWPSEVRTSVVFDLSICVCVCVGHNTYKSTLSIKSFCTIHRLRIVVFHSPIPPSIRTIRRCSLWGFCGQCILQNLICSVVASRIVWLCRCLGIQYIAGPSTPVFRHSNCNSTRKSVAIWLSIAYRIRCMYAHNFSYYSIQ